MNIFVWRKNSSMNYICAILYYIKKYKKILHFIEWNLEFKEYYINFSKFSLNYYFYILKHPLEFLWKEKRKIWHQINVKRIFSQT